MRAAKPAPKRKPGKWDKPERPAHATKSGPGRKPRGSANTAAARVMTPPEPLRKLTANVGRNAEPGGPRRVWREGEPMHIVRPVRAARRAEKRSAE